MSKSKATKKSNFTPFRDFEGRNPTDKHLRLTDDMMSDPTFISLSATSKVLYIYMRLWAGYEDVVTYSASLASDIMPSATFYRARNELVEKGFIDYLNAHHHKRDAQCKNAAGEYRFTKKWQYKSSN